MVIKVKSHLLLMQVLRSVGQWSAGTSTETSIQNAYRDTIARAEHFIYIEVRVHIVGQLTKVKYSN